LEELVLTKPPAGKVPHWYPPQKGLHVLKQMGNGTFHLWRDANALHQPTTLQVAGQTFNSVRKQLEPFLKMHLPPKQHRHLKQAWQLFAATGANQGKRLNTLDALKAERLVLAYEGGQWIWPVVSEGHKQRVEGLKIGGQDVILETISTIPAVFAIEGFLMDKECDHIINNGKDRVEASPVALMDHDKGKPATEWRTSSQAWLDPRQLPPGIKQRTASMLRVPIENQETHVQFLKYAHGQKYDAHNDYFDMAFYKNQPEMMQQYDLGYKNRLSTTFWYMSTIPEGGETQFPRAGGKPHISNFHQCQGLRVKPVKGKVILFYSLLPSGAYDEYSLHGGCPVLGDPKIVKWAANQWTWNKPM